jgi:uncharacterized protein (UPF0216 family)
MSAAQLITLGLGVVGFFITWTGIAVGLTRFAESIKNDTSEKIAAEVLARTKALADATEARNKELDDLRKEFNEAQRTQDHNVGEMGAALRRFIETVEKEMHAIEMWGRDHYVQKTEFERATDSIRDDITALRLEIKADFKELGNKIDAKH